MRTTITLDDDVFCLVKRYAEDRSVPLGKAVSDLVRKGFTVRRPTRVMNGIRVFDLPADSPRTTTRKVRELEAEDE